MKTNTLIPVIKAMLNDEEFLWGGIFTKEKQYAKKYDLKNVVYAEISLYPLVDAKKGKLHYTALDKYPSVARDIALVIDKEVNAEEILDTVRRAGKKLIKSLEIFDVYEGEHVEKCKKSIALHIVYLANDHTLKEEEIAEVHSKILSDLNTKLHAELRA